jgi:hypothetical protein
VVALQQENLVNVDPLLQIAERAYFIWKEQGCPEGKDLENWFEAEAEFSKEKPPEAPAATVAASQTKRPQRKKRIEIGNDRAATAISSLLM